jgi:hypothetical protein
VATRRISIGWWMEDARNGAGADKTVVI